MKTEARRAETASAQKESVWAVVESLQNVGVKVNMPWKVKNFLLSHPHVTDALPNVTDELLNALGHDTQLLLDVDASPGPASHYLVMTVRRPEYDEQVLEVMHSATIRVLRLAPNDPRFLVTSDFVASA